MPNDTSKSLTATTLVVQRATAVCEILGPICNHVCRPDPVGVYVDSWQRFTAVVHCVPCRCGIPVSPQHSSRWPGGVIERHQHPVWTHIPCALPASSGHVAAGIRSQDAVLVRAVILSVNSDLLWFEGEADCSGKFPIVPVRDVVRDAVNVQVVDVVVSCDVQLVGRRRCRRKNK